MRKIKEIRQKVYQNLKETWVNKLLAILVEGAGIASVLNNDGDGTAWLFMTLLALVLFFMKESLLEVKA